MTGDHSGLDCNLTIPFRLPILKTIGEQKSSSHVNKYFIRYNDDILVYEDHRSQGYPY